MDRRSRTGLQTVFLSTRISGLADVIGENVEFNRDAFTRLSEKAQTLIRGKNKDNSLLWLTWPLAVVFLTVGVAAILSLW